MTTSHASIAGAKRSALLLCLSLIAAGFCGCGSSGKPAPIPYSPSSTPASLPGDWEFTATNSTGSAVPIGAYLTSTGTAVSGTAWVQAAFPTDCSPTCCGGPFAEFSPTLTGSLSSAGALTLTSTVPNGGPVFTVTGTMTGASMSGTFNLTGGCPDQGTMTGVLLPSLDGTYAGTMTSQNTGSSYRLSTTLEQSTTLNTRGLFSVSGTAAFTGYPCLTTATAAQPLVQNSGFLGNQFGVTMTGANGGTLSISGTLSQDGKTIAASYTVGEGSCSLDYGTGTLTLQ